MHCIVKDQIGGRTWVPSQPIANFKSRTSKTSQDSFQSVTEPKDGDPSPAGRWLYQNIDLAQSRPRVIDII